MKSIATCLLAASLLAVTAQGVQAEAEPEMLAARAKPAQVQGDARPKGGFLAFLTRPATTAEDAQTGSEALELTKLSPDKARALVKEAVARASANRPKGRLWCVPFARAVTGVALRGNARTWWAQAAGRYQRGKEPLVGAVMNFAASRAMPKGHVAVVSQVLGEREILVDHANWERNRISTDVLVVDVSAKGDWSQVRVANSSGTLGRSNPVYGFIYN